MENDSMYKEIENKMRKEIEIHAEKMLSRLIDEGYSKEILQIFPPSKGIVVLKNLSYLFFVLSIASYFFTHSLLVAIGIAGLGILCYWLCGLIRGTQLKKDVLANRENFTKFQDLYKRLYE